MLVVEDNAEMRRFVCEALAPQFRTEAAADGAEGLERAAALRPDLVLSDLMMPGMSGDALVRAMGEHPYLGNVPVVLLTAKDDDQLRVDLLRRGALDYVMKPFSTEELKARIGNLVTMKRAREILQRELSSKTSDLETLASEVAQHKREIVSALDNARVARAQAEEVSQLKTNFLGLVSHELRTPLTSLGLYVERMMLAGDGALTATQQHDIVKKMRGSTTRLTDMVESLLEYARIEAGRVAAAVHPVDLPLLWRRRSKSCVPMPTPRRSSSRS